MTEHFFNLGKKPEIQIQEAQRVPKKMNVKRPTLKYIIIVMTKVKEKNLKSRREKQIAMYKGTPIFSAETLQARRIGIMYSK